MVADLSSVPLVALTKESRSVLSALLNPKKILTIVGPDQLSRHRDWRGLASLLNISNELAASFNECLDKTDKILDIWIKRNDGTATVGRLLVYLQILDRYDLHDDLLELARDSKLVVQSNNALDVHQVVESIDGSDEELITFDDQLFGRPQRYHAYVLYADQDKPFVDELLYRMRSEGFKMCTEEDLRAGHATKFEPVSRLITERSRYIILIYSPDFINSPAIKFCMNLAQADAISKKQIKIIPVMYRQCALPSHIAHYHSLRYSAAGAERHGFWRRLANSLRIADTPRINIATSHSNLSIAEISRSFQNRQLNGQSNGFNHLALADVPKDSASLNDLHRLHVDSHSSFETKSLSNSSETSEGRKKSGTFRKIFNTFRGKKHKKAIAVEN